jgi:hypothetical protein
MANKWTREKIKLPKTLKPKERVQIAEVVINHIINRTTAGQDRNNKDFPKYTAKYADEKGVGTGEVDLILSGEMLESIELISHKSGEIIIGYKDPSDELAGKVEGNRIGSYGGEPNSKKARDFLGIASDDLEVLIDAYQSEEELEPLTDEELDILSRQLAEELLDEA